MSSNGNEDREWVFRAKDGSEKRARILGPVPRVGDGKEFEEKGYVVTDLIVMTVSRRVTVVFATETEIGEPTVEA